MNPVTTKPVPKRLTWYRWFLATFCPGFCRYCGKGYRNCFTPPDSFFFPLPNRGKCCPYGHMGYIEHFDPALGFWKEQFDFVKEPHEKCDNRF
jgi:hypothetical protein